MNRPRPSPTIDAIIALLEHHPDGLTKDEICRELGKAEGAIESSIRHERYTYGPVRLHIARWQRSTGKGGRPSAVYVAGPGVDAERPSFSSRKDKRARQAKYRARHKAVINARLRVRRGTTTANMFSQLIR
jgi:hypothetical protein